LAPDKEVSSCYCGLQSDASQNGRIPFKVEFFCSAVQCSRLKLPWLEPGF
jgi:hypothetical protein